MSQQLVLDLPHRPAQGREDFLVASSNQAAVAWIDRWPDWQGGALALYGAPGSGKSHLAEVWRAKSGGILVNPADVTVDAIPRIAAAGAVILDHAETLQNSAALLHLINLLRQDGGYLLCLSALAPGRWDVPLADLRSRLVAMQSVGISEPDDHLLGAVMQKLLSDRQLRAPLEVISFLVARIERSFAVANRVVILLDSLVTGEKRPITIALARKALAQLAEISDTHAG